MSPRTFAFGNLLLLAAAVAGTLYFKDSAEWITRSAQAMMILLGWLAFASIRKERQAERRASLQARFSKMVRHGNARPF